MIKTYKPNTELEYLATLSLDRYFKEVTMRQWGGINDNIRSPSFDEAKECLIEILNKRYRK